MNFDNEITLTDEVKIIVDEIFEYKDNQDEIWNYFLDWGLLKSYSLRSKAGVHTTYDFESRSWDSTQRYDESMVLVKNNKGLVLYPLLYVDRECRLWSIDIKNVWKLDKCHYYYMQTKRKTDIPVKLVNGEFVVGTFLQAQSTIESIVAEFRPYLYKYCKDADVDTRVAIMAPQIEILDKAKCKFIDNYCFASWEEYIQHIDSNLGFIKGFNECCSNGASPKDILACEPKYFNKYRNIRNIFDVISYKEYVDTFGLSADNIPFLSENYSSWERMHLFDYYKAIHNRFANISVDKFIKSIIKLSESGRVRVKNAPSFIFDYCQACYFLDVTPRLLSHRLLEEHDRLSIEYRQLLELQREEQQANLNSGENENLFPHGKSQFLEDVYAYKEEEFFIKCLTTKEDFIEEAKQQKNCVATLYESWCSRRRQIWVARRCDNPTKSLATLLPYDDFSGFLQKYYAFNKPITDTPMLDFLKRALKHARDVRDKKVEPIMIEIKNNKLVVTK